MFFLFSLVCFFFLPLETTAIYTFIKPGIISEAEIGKISTAYALTLTEKYLKSF